MTVSAAYTNWAATYDSDRNLTRDLDQIVTQRLLGGLRCHTIVEIGCGTGKNTPLLGETGRLILALDFSTGMLAQARAKPQPAHAHFAAADLTQPWPCAHACADLIVCNLVLEHIRDLVAVFAEAHRVLRPGGQFFICELHPFRQYQGKQATFQRDGQPVEIPAFVHHISVFLNEAQAAGFRLTNLNEWWHETDQEGLPRLVSILFEK